MTCLTWHEHSRVHWVQSVWPYYWVDWLNTSGAQTGHRGALLHRVKDQKSITASAPRSQGPAAHPPPPPHPLHHSIHSTVASPCLHNAAASGVSDHLCCPFNAVFSLGLLDLFCILLFSIFPGGRYFLIRPDHTEGYHNNNNNNQAITAVRLFSTPLRKKTNSW